MEANIKISHQNDVNSRLTTMGIRFRGAAIFSLARAQVVVSLFVKHSWSRVLLKYVPMVIACVLVERSAVPRVTMATHMQPYRVCGSCRGFIEP